MIPLIQLIDTQIMSSNVTDTKHNCNSRKDKH